MAVPGIVVVDRGNAGFGFAMADKSGHEDAAPKDEFADTEAPASAVGAVSDHRAEPEAMAETDYMEGHEMEVLDPEPALEIALDSQAGLGAVHWQLVAHLAAVKAVQFGMELGAAVVTGAEHEAGLVVDPELGIESELDQKPEVELDHKLEEDNLA